MYWALLWVIAPLPHHPIDYFLADILERGGHAGGDPGWEIENLTSEDGQGEFYVWVDPDLLPLERHEGRYAAAIVRVGIRHALLEYLVSFPEKKDEVDEVLSRYGL